MNQNHATPAGALEGTSQEHRIKAYDDALDKLTVPQLYEYRRIVKILLEDLPYVSAEWRGSDLISVEEWTDYFQRLLETLGGKSPTRIREILHETPVWN